VADVMTTNFVFFLFGENYKINNQWHDGLFVITQLYVHSVGTVLKHYIYPLGRIRVFHTINEHKQAK
jgi:hypothetical protein